MNDRKLIAVGVLGVVLFVALALFVLLLTEDNEGAKVTPPPEPPHEQVASDSGTSVDVAPKPSVALVLDAGVREERPPEIIAVDGEGQLTEAQLRPFVAQVRRIIDQCSKDLAQRHKPPHEVTLSFEVRADGENGHAVEPVLEKRSVQDPYFEACVTDAPLDVQLPLPAAGAAKVRVRYP